tara:strand:- start:2926 stop:3774 length:849 start_codon:yes stop_codon:yes gene_type:complete
MFFKKFPNIDYDFEGKGETNTIKNIFRSVRALPTFLDEFTGYSFYHVINGERPDIVSQRLYGSSEFYWTFFVINDFLHDGYRVWPLSQEDLEEYFETHYSGKVITTNPRIEPDSDGLDTTVDSLAGKFDLGSIVHGGTSGAKGTIVKKNIDMNQLVIQDITEGTAGVHPITGASDSNFSGGPFQSSEQLVQELPSSHQVKIDKVFNYIDAPYQYFKTGDTERKQVTNKTFIDSTDSVDENQLSFITNRLFETERNDQRSFIRYVQPTAMGDFVKAFNDLIQE